MALACGLRYFGLAALLWLLGDRVTTLLARHRRAARRLLWAVAVLLAGHALWRALA